MQGKLAIRLKELFYQACKVNRWYTHDMKIMRNTKLREEFQEELIEFLRGYSFWCDGYFAKIGSHADEESVHNARVAVRRMRSDLRTFLSILDETWACDLRERMRWLQDGFSAARDADVLLANVRRTSADLPDPDRSRVDDVLAPLRAAREQAYDRMRAMLHDPRYAELLQELVDAAKRPPLTAAAAEPACDVIAEIVGDAWSALRKRVRRRAKPPADRELHAIRIGAEPAG